MLKKTYLVIGICILSVYTASGLFGWELRGSNKRSIQAAKSTTGGVRGFHFWHSRYHGGK